MFPSVNCRFFGPHNDATTKTTDNKRRLKLIRSYAPDWILTILLAVVFFALNSVHGFRRGFSVNDDTIRFPYAVHERVPDIALYFLALVAPLAIQLIVNLLTVRSFWDYHNSALGLILGLAITGAITQFSKITVGRPRPDLLSRCIPISDSQDPTYGLSTDAICTQTNQSIMLDGWRSFPSGHSSLSFAGLGFLSFYLAGKMHLFDTRGHTHKAWISVTPLACCSPRSHISYDGLQTSLGRRHRWLHLRARRCILRLSTIFPFTRLPYVASTLFPSCSTRRACSPLNNGGCSTLP
ncbi:phosphatidic acid phosphatase type 2/haloperoxidase [Chiua virens]|nr:phosphatidic acid phosphatase type 2/haloperoxidase [Chiua virens]